MKTPGCAKRVIVPSRSFPSFRNCLNRCQTFVRHQSFFLGSVHQRKISSLGYIFRNELEDELNAYAAPKGNTPVLFLVTFRAAADSHAVLG